MRNPNPTTEATMPAQQDNTKKVKALIKKHGLSGASRLLDLHHSSLTRIACGMPVLRTTATIVQLRLSALGKDR
jgi:hypothetical protein